MNNLYELSRIVMPALNFLDYKELFINKHENICEFNNSLKNVNEYKFNTWMNLFAAKKYFYYCDLGNVYLKINAKGQYQVKIIGSNLNPAFDRIDDVLIEQNCIDETVIKIPMPEKYEGIYFSIVEDKSNPIELKACSWCTDKEPQRDNKLAIVTCTFKRKDYINKNIALFEDFINKNTELSEKIKLIVVDNGKTIEVNRSNEKVKIIPNINAGGAGGFTRGLIDVLENYSDFTRVLFMDDDVEIFPESFYRTLILSNYLKDEFKDAFINGAMLDLYYKNLFYENCAIQDRLWVYPYLHDIKLTNYSDILKINNIPPSIFESKECHCGSAWYYHCFDIKYSPKQLPLPIFFRGDDIEWSWRYQGTHHISMNGINIWHAPFIWRVSGVADYYYLPRNMFMINSIYTNNFKSKYKKYFIQRAKYLSQTYNYITLELLVRSMKDILKGSAVFKENPEEQFKEINAIAKKRNYRICDNPSEMCWVEKAKVKWWRKILYAITNCGKYCPMFLYKSKNKAPEWYPDKKYFMLTKKVSVYNLFTQKCEERKYDRKLNSKLIKEFNTLLKEIDKNYDRLHNEYLQAHKELTSMDFWRKYLDINE